MAGSEQQPAKREPCDWDRRDTAILAAFLACFIASRIFWLATSPGSSQYWEEGYRWLATEEIAGGGALPLLDYQADHYQGGSLLVIVLAVALSGLGLGSLAALKAVALGFSSATLVALYGITRIWFGRSAGLLAGLIYLLGPPLVAFWGVVAMGFHSESVLLSLLSIGVFLGLSSGTWRGSSAWFAFGAISGLAVWFTPTAAIALLACVLTWPLIAPLPQPRALLAATAGLALGLAPWLLYNATHEFAGLARVFEVFGLQASSDPWRNQGLLERAADLLVRVPSQGLLEPGGGGPRWMPALVAGVWFPAGVALALALSRAFGVVRQGRTQSSREARCELVFLVYVLVFSLIYLLSRFTLNADPSPIGFRLMVPPAVLLIPPIAVSGARALRRRAGWLPCALGLLCLGASTLGFARNHVEPGTPLTLKAGDLTWGRLLHRKYEGDVSVGAAMTDFLPDQRRALLLSGIGWGIEAAYENSGTLDDVRQLLDRIDPEDRRVVEKGIWFWQIMSRRKIEAALESDGTSDQLRVLARLDTLAAWMAPSIVLITLDTTRVDHLSCYGYERKTTPNLDRLAQRAVRFRRAWSTSSWTLPAHASLFTGMYPSRHGARYDSSGSAALGDVLSFPGAQLLRAGMLADGFTTLAELLSAAGYRTGAFVAGPWLHRDFGLLQGFDHRVDEVTDYNGRPAHEITATALEWLDGIPPEEPYFLFANYFDPHAPYRPVGKYADLPRARQPFEFDYEALIRGTARIEGEQRQILLERYDAEIRDMDRAIGTLLDAIAARPNGDRALVIITADHGEALGEEGRIGHGLWLSEELTRVPLIVRYPRDRAANSWRDEPVQLVDVPHIVAEELGIKLPADVEGVALGERESAFSEIYREARTAARFGDAFDRDLQAVVRWPHKLVRSDRGDETLTRLALDALREKPIAEPERATALGESLDAHASSRPAAPLVAPTTSPEIVDALRQLGYVE